MAETPTQDFLKVKDIKEGILILENNDIRGILAVSSINFALKSEKEQSAILYGFQSFLNSLDFFCQIIVQSRNINITPYVEKINSLEKNQTNELLKTQISSYSEFIKELVKGENVMTKNFYLIVPYSIIEILGVRNAMQQSVFSRFSGKKEEGGASAISDDDFIKCRNQLWQRMEYLAMGLKRCSLDAVPLTTLEIIELLWALHHPSEAEIGYYPEVAPELIK